MEDTLDRGRARLSRGARGAGLGGLRATAWDLPDGPHAYEQEGGDKGVRGERDRFEAEGRQRPRTRSTGRRSGRRAVKRGSPRSRLHRKAPSPKVPAPRVSGRAEPHAKTTFAWSSTEPQGSGKRATLRGRCAGNRRSTSARVERFRSAEVDRTHRRSRRPVEMCAEKRTAGTRDLARTNRGSRTRPPGGSRAKTVRGPSPRLSKKGDAGWSKPPAQASSGSHPEGCGLGDSGSPRAASGRLPIRWKGVRVAGCVSLNPGCVARLWPRR